MANKHNTHQSLDRKASLTEALHQNMVFHTRSSVLCCLSALNGFSNKTSQIVTVKHDPLQPAVWLCGFTYSEYFLLGFGSPQHLPS